MEQWIGTKKFIYNNFFSILLSEELADYNKCSAHVGLLGWGIRPV